MSPDPRLLVPATRALLDGWCGPVDASGNPAALLWGWDESALVAWLGLGVGSLRQVPMSTLSLDLSRAECRDRVARVVAEKVGLLRMGAKPVCTAPDFTTRFDLPHWTMAGPQFGNGGGGSSLTWIPSEGFCDELAYLNPNNDTRLSDGSRLMDALALAAVARQVLGGTP